MKRRVCVCDAVMNNPRKSLLELACVAFAFRYRRIGGTANCRLPVAAGGIRPYIPRGQKTMHGFIEVLEEKDLELVRKTRLSFQGQIQDTRPKKVEARRRKNRMQEAVVKCIKRDDCTSIGW
jgi:hypothetical protein